MKRYKLLFAILLVSAVALVLFWYVQRCSLSPPISIMALTVGAFMQVGAICGGYLAFSFQDEQLDPPTRQWRQAVLGVVAFFIVMGLFLTRQALLFSDTVSAGRGAISVGEACFANRQ